MRKFNSKTLLAATIAVSLCALPAFADRSGGVIGTDLMSPVSGTFANGSADYGAAIYNAGTITIEDDTVFENNTSTGHGGAIYNSGTATLGNNISFIDNFAGIGIPEGGTLAHGSAIYNDGGSVSIGDNLTVKYNTEEFTDFTENGGGHNCAIYSEGGSLAIGNNATFSNVAEAIILNNADLVIGDNLTIDKVINGLIVQGTSDVTIGANATISNSIGRGIELSQSGDITLNIGDNFLFENNSNELETYSFATIYLDDNHKIQFKGTSKFSNNTVAKGNAGVFQNFNGTLIFDGEATFENNYTSGVAGALRNRNTGSSATFNAAANFTNNKAVGDGGAVINEGTLTFNDAATFVGNHAGIVLEANGSDWSVKDGEFTPLKSGGAVYNTGTVTFGDGTLFQDNTSTGHGGAIYNSGTAILGNNISFIDNFAGIGIPEGGTLAHGSAIYNDGGSVSIGDNLTVKYNTEEFTDFTENGGGHNCAIYSEGGSLAIGNNATFSNVAEAIVLSNADMEMGDNLTIDKVVNGLIVQGTSDVTIGANATISNSIGRGIELSQSGDITLNIGDNFLFENNSNELETNSFATIYLDDNHKIQFNGTSKFLNNTAANGNAGVFQNFNGTLVFDGEAIFENNYTSGVAGALRNRNTGSSATFNDNASFTNNVSVGDGAAILNEGTLTFEKDATFAGNIAGTTPNDIHNTGTINFNGNTSLEGGITGAGILNFGANSTLSTMGQEAAGTSVIEAATINVTDGAKLSFDWGDTIDAAAISGEFTFNEIYFTDISDFATATTELFLNATQELDLSGVKAYTSAGTYQLAQTTDKKGLKFELAAAAGGLNDAVADTSDSQKQNIVYDMAATEEFQKETGDDTTIQNANFTINGNGNTVNSETGAKLIVDTDSKLNAEDVVLNVNVENNGELKINFENVTDANYKGITGTGNTSVFTNENVDFNISNGITQDTITFAGVGHLELSGGEIVGDIINEMTGDTLVISTAVTGNLNNTAAGAHAELATGAAISGTITNEGLLDITASEYIINNGIATSDISLGTTNIGDGTNSSKVTLLAGKNVAQNNITVNKNASLINDGSVEANYFNSAGTVSGNGELKVNNDSINAGAFEQKSLIIAQDATFETSAENFKVTESIKNDGTLSIIGGDKLTSNVEGYLGTDGTIWIEKSGNFTIDATIKDNYIVNEGATLMFANPETNIANASLLFGMGSVNLQNDKIDTLNMRKMYIAGDSKIFMDVDAAKKDMDKLNPQDIEIESPGTITVFTNMQQSFAKANVSDKEIQLSPIASSVSASVKETLAKNIKVDMPKQIDGAIYKYDTAYDPSTGMISLSAGSGNDYTSFSPAAVVAPVAAQTAYMNQLNNYQEAFATMDALMMTPSSIRTAIKNRNKYAAGEGLVTFDPNQLPEESSGVWFNPYASYDKVDLKRGPKVKDFAYGSLVGLDLGMKEYSNGWSGLYNVYAGYNGNRVKYDGVSMNYNGGVLGLTGVWYKNNFFTGLTANIGAGMFDANTAVGSEDFGMLTGGVASKTGYNYELFNGKFTIQPSLLVAYTIADTFDYTNASGLRVDTDPLNAITIQPGLKFIGNTKSGWQPYAGVSMVWNIIDENAVKVQDVNLPKMSIKPYVQYGVGVKKSWGERFTGWLQVVLRNGGRDGVAGQLGMKYALGKGSVGNQAKSDVKTTDRAGKIKLSLK